MQRNERTGAEEPGAEYALARLIPSFISENPSPDVVINEPNKAVSFFVTGIFFDRAVGRETFRLAGIEAKNVKIFTIAREMSRAAVSHMSPPTLTRSVGLLPSKPKMPRPVANQALDRTQPRSIVGLT
jgi:hypothetical protein